MKALESYMITAANYRIVKTTLEEYFDKPLGTARILIVELERLAGGDAKSAYKNIQKIEKILQKLKGY